MTEREELHLMEKRERAFPAGNLKRTRKMEGKPGVVIPHMSRERMLVSVMMGESVAGT